MSAARKRGRPKLAYSKGGREIERRACNRAADLTKSYVEHWEAQAGPSILPHPATGRQNSRPATGASSREQSAKGGGRGKRCWFTRIVHQVAKVRDISRV